jgi:4-amino-4-deoxy-L-arabinose transferase-like glycosyltransferase
MKSMTTISGIQTLPVPVETPRPLAWDAAKISFACILGAAVLILTGNLGVIPLWGAEGRWAMISRHMVDTGELFRPLLGNSVYWDKPLLSYWAVLPFAALSGGVSETVIRLPSVLAALLLLALTVDLARKWFDAQTALCSMMILSTSYGFIFWARNAQVEMFNAFFILLAIWYFLKRKEDPSPRWMYLLGGIMAVGAGFKGLPAYGVPIFTIGLLLLFKQKRPSAMTWPHIIGSLALSMALYIGFQLIVCYFAGTWAPLELVWKENVIRFFKPFDHKGSIWTYFIRIFDLAAPWSLLLPAALVYLRPKLRIRASGAAELLVIFGAVFLFFTLSGSRRSYYLLPILPFASILAGRFMVDFFNNRMPRSFSLYVKAFGVLLSIILIAPMGILLTAPRLLPGHLAAVRDVIWWIALILAIIPAILSFGIFSRSGRVVGAAVMAAWCIYIFAAVPLYDQVPNIRNKVADIKSSGRPVAFYPVSSDRIWFYLDHPCQVFAEEKTAFDWAVKHNGLVFVRRDHEDGLSKDNWTAVENLRKYRAMVPCIPEGGCSQGLMNPAAGRKS